MKRDIIAAGNKSSANLAFHNQLQRDALLQTSVLFHISFQAHATQVLSFLPYALLAANCRLGTCSLLTCRCLQLETVSEQMLLPLPAL